MKVSTVFIVEPEAIVRDALTLLINSFPDYEVTGTASTAEDALNQLSVTPSEVVITEMSLPMQSGLELIQGIKSRKVNSRIVVLAHFISETSERNALSLGANAVLPKSSPTNALLSALSGSNGASHTDSALDHLIERDSQLALTGQNSMAGIARGNDPLGLLSNREREIFHYLANGMPNAAIAKQLFISPRTVETHRARIVRKLGIKTNAELIRYAIREGVAGI